MPGKKSPIEGLCWHTISFHETHLLFRYIRGLIDQGIRILKGLIDKGRDRISVPVVSVHDPRLLHPDCFRARAKEAGIDENDPALVRAVKALEEWEVGTMTAEELNPAFEELDAALDAFIETHKRK